MTRLKHSFGGYLRYMQMSGAVVFAFVEGKTDPYFYGKLCESVCRRIPIKYEVCQAQELPGSTGGKQAVLEFYSYLKRRGSLMDALKGKKTASVFFLDKDVDDLTRNQKRSKHVVYTRFYDCENHVFNEGNLLEAVSSAASVDRTWLRSQVVDIHVWRKDAAEKWKEWVKLCVFAKKKKILGAVNYGRVSQINAPLNGSVDAALYAGRRSNLRTSLALSSTQFKKAFDPVSRYVDQLYLTNEFDRVFKGKWYPPLLEAEIRTLAGSLPINSNGLASRLATVLSVTVDFEQPWADHFKDPLKSVIQELAH